MTKKKTGLMGLGVNMWMLGLDASCVIAMRTAKIAMGGANGEREARKMVSEKFKAQSDLGVKLVTGKLGQPGVEMAENIVEHYAAPVRANRKRLSN